jgi:hypothetical protein
MRTTDLKLKNVREVNVTPSSFEIDVEITNADIEEIVDQLSAKDMVKWGDVGDMLDAIGIDEVKEHFNLIEKED